MRELDLTGNVLSLIAIGVALAVVFVTGLAFLAFTTSHVLLEILDALLATNLGTLHLTAIVLVNLAWLMKGMSLRRALIGNILLLTLKLLTLHLTGEPPWN